MNIQTLFGKLKRWHKQTGKIIYGVLLAAVIGIGILVVLSASRIPGRLRLFVVQSGSMEPSIHIGSITVVKPQAQYQIGDVITLQEPANPKVTLTHRITEIRNQNGKFSYVTRGDANDTADLEIRPAENVIGRTILSIPLIGYAVGFAKTRNGLLFLVILPAIFIATSEIITIKNEILRKKHI